MATGSKKRFVVCVSNRGYSASLEKGKLYLALPDPAAEKRGLLRVIDESGEDYLYPKRRFADIELPRQIERALAR